MIYLQKHMKKQINLKKSKIEILEKYWYKMYVEISALSVLKQDKETQFLIEKIVKINPEIRHHILDFYL